MLKIKKVFFILVFLSSATLEREFSVRVANALVPTVLNNHIKICYENAEVFPYYIGEGDLVVSDFPGISIEIMNDVVKKLDLKVLYLRMPWKRCLSEVMTGAFEIALSPSYNPERAAQAVFPMNGDKPDDKYRLSQQSYIFFVLNTSDLEFKDSKLSGNIDEVVIPRGYSVAKTLQGMGLKIREVNDLRVALLSLTEGRAKVAALLSEATDSYIISNNKEFGRIKKLEPYIEKKSYFPMMSRKFAQDNPELPQKIWQSIADSRDAKQQELMKKYLEYQLGHKSRVLDNKK